MTKFAESNIEKVAVIVGNQNIQFSFIHYCSGVTLEMKFSSCWYNSLFYKYFTLIYPPREIERINTV